MNKSRLLAATSVLALSSIAATAAFAQDIEQVVVSASRVTISGYTQPTPVTTVGAAQLESAGYADIAQSIQQLPSVGIGNAPNNGTSGVGSGTAGGWVINLRNLGVLRTLTLFDGQRVNGNNVVGGGTDLGTIPSDLVQRVDVVTGGASAAWGSDAVAGVVNVIINKNFTGFKAGLMGTDNTYHMPGYKVTATYGTDLFNGRAHFEASFAHEDTPDGVFKNADEPPPIYLVNNPTYKAGNGQAALIHMLLPNNVLSTAGGLINASPKGTTAAANALRGISFTGQTAAPTAFNFGTVPLLPGAKLSSIGVGGTPNGIRSDALSYQMAGTPYHSTNIFTYTSYKLTDSILMSLQASYSDQRLGNGSGSGASVYTGNTIKSGNPFIPTSVQNQMTTGGITSFTMGNLLFCDLGASQIDHVKSLDTLGATCGMPVEHNSEQQIRVVGTLTGELGDDWSWNAYYEHGQMHEIQALVNDPVKSRVALALDAVIAPAGNTAGLNAGTIVCRDTLTNPGNGCFPMNAFGTGNVSQDARNYISPAINNRYSLAQDVVEGSIQGKLPWGLSAGRMATAFGVGYRKESAFILPNIFASTSDVTVGGTGNLRGAYNIIEGFGELDVPVLKDNIVQSLDFSAAGRMTSYSTSGLVETWKLGLTSQVNDDVRLRTTWSLDIRAPNVYELFNQPGGGAQTPTADPKTGAPVSAATITGGNPNLNPEVATTISGGVVLTPHWIPGLTMSADWYSINIKAAVYTLQAAFVLQQCTQDLSSQYCQYLTYNGAANGQGGKLLSSVNVTPQNASQNTTSGLDFAADYMMDLFAGSLGWHLVANYNDEITRVVPGQANVDSAGSFGVNSGVAGVPKFKATLAATYAEGPWSGTLQGRYLGSAVLDNSWRGVDTAGNPFVDDNHVAPKAYLDVRGSYSFNDHFQVYGAMDNVTNVSTPLVTSVASNFTITNTAFSTYDPLGRVYRVGLRYNY